MMGNFSLKKKREEKKKKKKKKKSPLLLCWASNRAKLLHFFILQPQRH